MAAIRSIEDTYKKMKDQHEHILKRPGMHIGSTKMETSSMWVYNENHAIDDCQLIYRQIEFVPGLFKIFDEILVNTRDHVVRCFEENKELCTRIKVTIDASTGHISVWNNGAGIPVVKHKIHQVYIPTMIFGQLMTSTNYNDNEKRKVGGTNGLGAKLTNIFSTEFVVQTLDTERGKHFYQKFENNMYTVNEPVIEASDNDRSYTQISFVPDFARFGMTGLTDDFLALFKKRVYDIAMSCDATVYYNNQKITPNGFEAYVDRYFDKTSEIQKIIEIVDDWRVCVVYNPTNTLDHQVISFVNGINTNRGGTHADYVINQVVKALQTKITKKSKELVVKTSLIKENLLFVIDCTVINPEFDNQSKEKLVSKVTDFGSTYTASKSFLTKIAKTGIIENVIAHAQSRAMVSLSKVRSKTNNIAKLYDAHDARLKKGDCTLILTEGDSAKTFAMSGFNVIGRKKYGVFPLKGKPINTRDESSIKVAKNEEIKAITQIVGLEYGKSYQNMHGLRYGSIMILTDQDYDGSHIKGLIMNFIHCYWPSLIKYEGFIKSFSTPLLKLFSKNKKNKAIIPFYSMSQFEQWKKDNDLSKWNAHYYKGLGTSTSKESQECFTDIDDKLISYYWESLLKTEKGENISEDAITLAFAKKRENDRKEWLTTYNPDYYIDNAIKRVSYNDFIHKELLGFSVYDTVRSIPSIMDGLKPGQRKSLAGCFKKDLYKQKDKLESLAGYITDNMAYHHGPTSLHETIKKMAQDYVGSNNLNLLLPLGGYGSRLAGGEDSASPRYIYTQLNPIVANLFIEADTAILQPQTEEGKEIEPVYYAPIIPIILINGAKGIGTGYSTKIEPCNPMDVILNLKRLLTNEPLLPMVPWYRHFTGSIEKIDDNRYISKAAYKIVKNTVHITDLPIGTWTDNYKAFLANLTNSNSKGAAAVKTAASGTAKVSKANKIGADIKDFVEDCTDVRIDIRIQFYPNKLDYYVKNNLLESELKLTANHSLSNMHLFDYKGKIRKYDSYHSILRHYAKTRLNLYQKRKDYLLDKYNAEVKLWTWKMKFIKYVIKGKIIVFKESVSSIKEQLQNHQFPLLANNDNLPSYQYLTSISIIHFSADEITKLASQIETKNSQIEHLMAQSADQIWLTELDQLTTAYQKWIKKSDLEYNQSMKTKVIS